ncbi:MAG TPA: NUDIX domain-containing protein [Chitinophagaceae bacterium]|nr:NUDIX hydrolase [Chitinophagaceae bacterium]MBP9739530.1 NUDIX hydrolase [Chitinophagaceae bacterium]HPH23324.1 NUDIX domain-containing protein [Chitinophagaceae bacterium]
MNIIIEMIETKIPKNERLDALIKVGEHGFLPSVSVDCVIFGFHEGELKVLLIKHRYRDMWSLPGGFVSKDEPCDAAAYRVLKDRTGLNDVFLQQFHVFGDTERYSKEFHLEDLLNDGLTVDDQHWLIQRFVTVGYYALVDFLEVQQNTESLTENYAWWELSNLPEFILDHKKILDKALAALRIQLRYQPIGYNLLPVKFTMPELQKLYETILGIKLDRRNFQRKILGYNILDKLDETKKGVPHKSPNYYQFNLLKYRKALEEGLSNGW